MSLAAATVARAALPLVDISDLASSDPRARAAVGQTLRAACLDKGFFYCAGHGVPDALVTAAFEEARTFFDQPLTRKEAVHKANSPAHRGYEAMGGQTLERGAPPDRKEGFYIGLELPADDPRVLTGRFSRGPNQWPADLPGFQPVMTAYFAAMLSVAERVMRGLALSLDLPEDAFAQFCREPIATLRLLHYPPQRPDAADGEKGAGAHTDFGGITLLAQDANGGLQVHDGDRGWIHATPIPDTFVVNLGDMIARWTNDRYRSTLHRVVNISGRERYSIPFFMSGNPDTEVHCLPSCLAPGETPKYPPTTIEAHLIAMYQRTYG